MRMLQQRQEMQWTARSHSIASNIKPVDGEREVQPCPHSIRSSVDRRCWNLSPAQACSWSIGGIGLDRFVSMAAPTSNAKHFVLVHGGAHGGWCWYKIVDLLQQAGHKVSALDLASAGINNVDPGKVETLHQLATPLLSFLQALPDSEKVILVVHSMGGLSGTLAMELFPGKIAAAIFVAALMFPDPEHENAGAIIQVFESLFATLMTGKVRLIFGNGAEKPPTAMEVGQDHVVHLFYHLSPSLDVALARLCLKPFPAWSDMGRELLVPITPERYGSVPRVYLDCKNDRAVSGDLADIMCRSLPPKERILLQADHSPFFSAPADLTAHLLRIAQQT